MYRAPQPQSRSQRIVYGPFPIRAWRLLAAVIPLFLGLVFTLSGLKSQTLECRREGDIVCEAVGFLAPDWRLTGTPSVRIETLRRGKGQGKEYGTVILESGGATARLMEVSGDEARELAARVRAWTTSTEPHLREDLSGSRWALLTLPIALAAFVSLLRSAFSGAGRLILEVGADALRVTRRLFGVSVRSWELSLARVEDVKVVWGREPKDFWLSKGQSPRELGSVCLVTKEGELRDVSAGGFPGRTLHLRAAAALRAALDLPPLPGGVESELAASESAPERPAWASRVGSRIGYAWVGACCGAILGMAAFGIGGFAVGVVPRKAALPTWVMRGALLGAASGVGFVLWLARVQVPR